MSRTRQEALEKLSQELNVAVNLLGHLAKKTTAKKQPMDIIKEQLANALVWVAAHTGYASAKRARDRIRKDVCTAYMPVKTYTSGLLKVSKRVQNDKSLRAAVNALAKGKPEAYYTRFRAAGMKVYKLVSKPSMKRIDRVEGCRNLPAARRLLGNIQLATDGTIKAAVDERFKRVGAVAYYFYEAAVKLGKKGKPRNLSVYKTRKPAFTKPAEGSGVKIELTTATATVRHRFLDGDKRMRYAQRKIADAERAYSEIAERHLAAYEFFDKLEKI